MATLTQQRVTEPSEREAADAASAAGGRRVFRLVSGEQPVSELQGEDGSTFLLTGMRVIYTGGPEEEAVVRAARLEDVATVEITRRPRDKRAVIWAVLGVLGAVGIWQVSSNEAIGAALGAVVAVIAFGFIADYWLRPGGLMLRFTTPGGAVEGAIGQKNAAKAAEFAASVEEARLAAVEAVRQPRPAPAVAAQAEAPRSSYPVL